jgi:hypothetical protein
MEYRFKLKKEKNLKVEDRLFGNRKGTSRREEGVKRADCGKSTCSPKMAISQGGKNSPSPSQETSVHARETSFMPKSPPSSNKKSYNTNFQFDTGDYRFLCPTA